MAVRAHLPGRQFGGPLPSAVLGGTGSAPDPGGLGSSRSSQGNITVNMTVNMPDAPSFLRSRGEIARQFQAAIATTRRS
jgi:hypothetical protein